MAKKPREGKKYSYMDTYGDLVTLLLCFFVLLFSMSTIEEVRYNAFVQALTDQFGSQPQPTTAVEVDAATSEPDQGEEPTTGEAMNPDQTMPEDFKQLAEAIEKYVEENNMQGEVSVEVGESGATFIRISDNLLFDGDSSVLRAQSIDFLNFLGECFLSVEEDVFQVRFIGHTASVRGSGTDDWVLSSERGGRVASYFERQVGFSPYKMETVGYGRHFPIADNNDFENGVPKNRRVDIVAISNDTDNLLMALAEASAKYFPNDDTQYFEGSEEDLPSSVLGTINATERFNLNNLSPEELEMLYNSLDK